MNKQQVYEAQRAHFTQPGVQLGKAPGTCRYRFDAHLSAYHDDLEDDLRMCAVGCVMTDEAYSESWEGMTVDVLRNELESQVRWGEVSTAAKALMAQFDLDDDELWRWLRETQEAHDNSATTSAEFFVVRLDDLARGHGLEVPPPAPVGGAQAQ